MEQVADNVYSARRIHGPRTKIIEGWYCGKFENLRELLFTGSALV
jgi:hypothetical protein